MMTDLTLYELEGEAGQRYSLFSWRTKLALKHKGLDYDTVPVLLSDKLAMAFSGGKTVPILVHPEGHVRDSLAIARWLEAAYPDRPSLFDGRGGEMVTITLNHWVDRVIVPEHMAHIAHDLHERIDPRDRDYFRRGLEAMFKTTLEDMQRTTREKGTARLSKALEPARATLKRQPFLGGDQPLYADYILFSPVQWARVMSPASLIADDDPIAAWRERMLDLFDGFCRSHPAAA